MVCGGEYIGKDTSGVLPNITGAFSSSVDSNALVSSLSGAFYGTTNWIWCIGTQGTYQGNYINPVYFSAHNSNSMYGSGWFDGDRVVPASIGMMFSIKY